MLQLASHADREAVNALAIEVHDLHVAWRPDLFCKCDLLYDADRFGAALEARELFVAKVDGTVVGYTLLKQRVIQAPGLISGREMIIEELCVDENVRGMGIGKQIMADIRALAKAFGCNRLLLGVYPVNEGAMAFYQNCGFSLRNIRMQCDL